jgi:hypothetical protein
LEDLKEKIPLRPRHTWEDNIKMCLIVSEIYIAYSNHVSQVCVQQRVVLNTIVYLYFPYTVVFLIIDICMMTILISYANVIPK